MDGPDMVAPFANLVAAGARRMASASRWLLAVAGLGCFALGAVGTVVPGLPTTVFLLLGSFFLTRSCPWLERRLVESALFRPYARYLDPSVPMPPRARAAALLAMWASIGATLVMLARGGEVAAWAQALIVAAGAAGTAAVLRFRKHLDRRAAGDPNGESV